MALRNITNLSTWHGTSLYTVLKFLKEYVQHIDTQDTQGSCWPTGSRVKKIQRNIFAEPIPKEKNSARIIAKLKLGKVNNWVKRNELLVSLSHSSQKLEVRFVIKYNALHNYEKSAGKVPANVHLAFGFPKWSAYGLTIKNGRWRLVLGAIGS